jgi:hypothetical protein
MRKLRLIAVLLAFCSCGDAQQWFSPKIKKGGQRICSIHVLPAQFTVLKFGFRGAQGLWEKGDELEDEFTALVGKMLSGHLASVSQSSPVAELEAAQRSILTAMQRNYDELNAQMERSPGGIEKGRYTLGDMVADYAPTATADTLVFIRGKGRVPASAGGALVHRSKIEGSIGLVDARTGDVIAFLSFECDGSHGRSTTMATGLASHILEYLGAEPSLYTFMGDGPAGTCGH